MPRKGPASLAKIVLCLGLEGGERARLPRDLRRFGYHPLTASFDEGLEAPMHEGEVRLVILDLTRRPDRAIELLRSLRSHAGERDLPVLLLVPVGGMDAIPRALEAGADDYLLKPIDSRLLFARVQQLAEANPRMHCRVPCDTPLEALTRSEFLTGETIEVGEGGLRAHLPRKVAHGELAVLRFHLPRQEAQLAAAAVCVFGRRSGGGFSAGFKFVLIEEAHLRRIREFIRRAEGRGGCPPPPPPGHRTGRA